MPQYKGGDVEVEEPAAALQRSTACTAGRRPKNERGDVHFAAGSG